MVTFLLCLLRVATEKAKVLSPQQTTPRRKKFTVKKNAAVYDRSPLNCSHPAYAVSGRKCDRCGAKHIPTFKPAPSKPYVSQGFTADDDAYTARSERETRAARA